MWNELANVVLDDAHPLSEDASSKAEVESAVEKLKNHKAPGLCGILPEMIKCRGDTGSDLCAAYMGEVWETSRALADWKRSLLVLLLQKGDPSDLGNYRGISLSSMPGKVYALILRQRLQVGLKAFARRSMWLQKRQRVP